MKRTVSLILILLCRAPSLIRAEKTPTPRFVLGSLALERAWNQAYKLGDTKALSAILDSSIVLGEDDGSLKTMAQFLATVKAVTANDEQVAPESLTVYVFGETAVGVISVKGKSGTHRERFIDT